MLARKVGLGIGLARYADVVDRLSANGDGVPPFDEDLHSLLMLALHRSHRRSDALAVFSARLRDELGIEPTAEMAGLHQLILTPDRVWA